MPVATPPPAYVQTQAVALGAPDRWDYVVFDPGQGRVFVAHGDRVTVVDAKSGAIVGQIQGAPGGTHGTAISPSTGQGFTDDGEAGTALAFDLKTLKVTKTIAADKDADGIVIDKATGHVFVVEGDPNAVTVIDPKTNTLVATIKAGEKLEYAAADGEGTVYLAGEEKKDLLRVDAKTNTVTARWPTPDCTSPHGLAYDAAGKRLFMSCVNAKMMVVDARSGKVVTELKIGLGSDAAVFDPVRKRVFSSNGKDGTISVYQQATPDRYEALPDVKTVVSARTMDVDPKTGRLFVAAAETFPAVGTARPKTKPGTLKLLMFDPAK